MADYDLVMDLVDRWINGSHEGVLLELVEMPPMKAAYISALIIQEMRGHTVGPEERVDQRIEAFINGLERKV